jgi:hypothetical protein
MWKVNSLPLFAAAMQQSCRKFLRVDVGPVTTRRFEHQFGMGVLYWFGVRIDQASWRNLSRIAPIARLAMEQMQKEDACMKLP